MIVDTVTGEILDLSPLRRVPKGRPIKRIDHRYPKRRTRADKLFVQTLALLGVIMVIAGYAALNV